MSLRSGQAGQAPGINNPELPLWGPRVSSLTFQSAGRVTDSFLKDGKILLTYCRRVGRSQPPSSQAPTEPRAANLSARGRFLRCVRLSLTGQIDKPTLNQRPGSPFLGKLMKKKICSVISSDRIMKCDWPGVSPRVTGLRFDQTCFHCPFILAIFYFIF